MENKEQQNEAIRSAMRQEMAGKYGRDDLRVREQTEFLRVIDGLVGFLFQVGLDSIDDYDPERDLRKICRLAKPEEIDLFVDLMARLESLSTTGEMLEVERVIDDQEYMIQIGVLQKIHKVVDCQGVPYVSTLFAIGQGNLIAHGPDGETLSVGEGWSEIVGKTENGLYYIVSTADNYWQLKGPGQISEELPLFKSYYGHEFINGKLWLVIEGEGGAQSILCETGERIKGTFEKVSKIIPAPGGGVYFAAKNRFAQSYSVFDESGKPVDVGLQTSEIHALEQTPTGFCAIIETYRNKQFVITEAGIQGSDFSCVLKNFIGENKYVFEKDETGGVYARTLAGERESDVFQGVGVPMDVNGGSVVPFMEGGRWFLLDQETQEEHEIPVSINGTSELFIYPYHETQYFIAHKADSDFHFFDCKGNEAFGLEGFDEVGEIEYLEGVPHVWAKFKEINSPSKWVLLNLDDGEIVSFESSEKGKAIRIGDRYIYARGMVGSVPSWSLSDSRRNTFLTAVDEIYSLEKIDEQRFYAIYKPIGVNGVEKEVFSLDDEKYGT
jgi:hypothetical protein